MNTLDNTAIQVNKLSCGTSLSIYTNRPIYNLLKRNEIYCKFKYDMHIRKSAVQYENDIGQTGTKLTDRVRVHKQQIRDPTLHNVRSGHFDSCSIIHMYE
jgi:hypothetical protein